MTHNVIITNILLATLNLIVAFNLKLRSQISKATYVNHCLMSRDRDILGLNREIRIFEFNDS